MNVLFSVYGRSLDVYVDGKLSRTCVLPGPAKIPEKADIKLFPTEKGAVGADDAGPETATGDTPAAGATPPATDQTI